MRKKGYRGVGCVKREFGKCKGICRTYDKIQTAFADVMQSDESIKTFECNVLMKGLTEGEYTSDFFAIKTDGSKMVRECVWRKNLGRPMTAKLLDISRNYWLSQDVEDWGIVIEKGDFSNDESE